LFALTFAVFGQDQQMELPDTALGKIVREWFQIIEAGKEDEIKEFIETRFSANALRNQPNAAHLFRKVHEQSGGLEILRVAPPTGEFPMTILAKSKKGERFVRITVGLDGGEKEKLAGLGIDKTETRQRLN
jgi:hypothetical protein